MATFTVRSILLDRAVAVCASVGTRKDGDAPLGQEGVSAALPFAVAAAERVCAVGGFGLGSHQTAGGRPFDHLRVVAIVLALRSLFAVFPVVAPRLLDTTVLRRAILRLAGSGASGQNPSSPVVAESALLLGLLSDACDA